MQRQTRSMERSNSMNRGKRSLDAAGGDDDQPERKRPALASVIVEALKVDSLQKLCSSLEPILRRVVSEEVERALAKLGGAPRIAGRSSPKRIEGSDERKLWLQFQSRLSLPLFTGGKVDGEHGASVHIVLIDANSGKVVTSGPESSAKLDVVVLEGDFNNEDDEDWSQEEFDSHVVKEREGKRPLLTGDLQITLKEGVGTLGELTFTDNSSWIRSRKFRLGLKVSAGFCDSMRVREAKTEAFTVKDHRGELYKKHYPPALNDEVWRLEKIGKDGSFHKRLNAAGIYYVEDFLRVAVKDSQKLRSILGSGMSNRMWEALMEHAKTCVLSGKLYVYYPDDSRSVGVVFNNIYELSGLIAGEQYIPANSLSDSQKVYVDTLVKKAYDNWHQVIEYDGKSLLSSKKTSSRRSISSRNELPPMAPVNNFSTAVDLQLSFPSLPSSVPSEQLLRDANLPHAGAGYINNLATSRYRDHAELVNSNSQHQVDNAAFSQQELLDSFSQATHIPRNDNGNGGLAISPPLHSSSPTATLSGFQPLINSSVQQSPLNLTFNDWSQRRDNNNVAADNLTLTEEEIRLRSHEMLENEDMQQLLQIFSMGGHHHHNHNAGMNWQDDGGFSFPSFSMPSSAPNFEFDMDRNRPVGGAGRAVAGWLKIKAAMRWGFFIREKAAERRAQLVELDE